MDLKLSQGEQVVKSWDYAKTKGTFFTKGRYNLTVTNKKIVSSYETKKSVKREDINLSEISGISAEYSKSGSPFLTFLGVLFCISIVGLPIGIIILIINRKGQLTLSALTDVSDYSMVEVNGVGGRFFGKKKKKLKLKVDIGAAKEIVSDISTVVSNIKNSAAV